MVRLMKDKILKKLECLNGVGERVGQGFDVFLMTRGNEKILATNHFVLWELYDKMDKYALASLLERELIKDNVYDEALSRIEINAYKED